MCEVEDLDLWQSLAQLLPDVLDDAHVEEAAESAVFRAVNAPLRRLQPEHLLLLVSQGVGLAYSVPLALSRLEDNPLLEAHSHPGDLLSALLLSDAAYWRSHKEEWNKVMDLLDDALAAVSEQLGEEQPLSDVLGDDFAAALMHFQGIHGGGANG